jgi:hypothetical protein
MVLTIILKQPKFLRGNVASKIRSTRWNIINQKHVYDGFFRCIPFGLYIPPLFYEMTNGIVLESGHLDGAMEKE